MTTLALGLRLARAGELRRALLIVVGVAIGTAVLLTVAAVARTFVAPDRDTVHLLEISIVALCVPISSLLAAVVRVSASVRDRRLAALRILGVSAGATRAAAAVETLTFAVGGAALGAVVFLALRPAMRGVHPAGHPLLHGRSLMPDAAGWVAVCAGVLALSVVVALSPARAVTRAPLAVRQQGRTSRPGWWRLFPLPAGLALLGYLEVADPPPDAGRLVLPFLAGVALAGIGLPLAVPVAIRQGADLIGRRVRAPGVVLAARRMQQEPAGTARLVATLLVVLFVVTGARCVLVAFQAQPDVVRYANALGAGPQAVEASLGAHQVADLRALRRVSGVRDVGVYRTGTLRCTPAEQTEQTEQDEQIDRAEHDAPAEQAAEQAAAQPGTPGSGQAVPGCEPVFLADCPALRGLGAVLRHCPAAPFWLVPAGESLAPDERRVRLVVTDSSGRAGPAHQVAVASVSRVLRVPGHPRSDPLWGWSVGPALVLPPDSRQVAAMLARTETPDLAAVLDGGTAALHRFVAAARRHGITAQSNEFPESYQAVQTYTAVLWTVASVLVGLGLVALLVTGYDRAVERRPHVASLAVVGVPLGVSRHSQLLQVAMPLLIGIPSAVASGLLAGDAYLRLTSDGGGPRTWVPWHDVLALAIAAALAGCAVAALTTAGLGRAVRAAELRRE